MLFRGLLKLSKFARVILQICKHLDGLTSRSAVQASYCPCDLRLCKCRCSNTVYTEINFAYHLVYYMVE